MFKIFTVAIIILGVCQINIGKRNDRISTRIVGGKTAEIDNFPYTVSLRSNNKHFCGGAIVGDVFVLTAAHCVIGMQPHWMHAHVGTGSLDKVGQACEVLAIYRHFQYQERDYDIAVIELKNKINFTDQVKKLRLPRPKELVELGVRAVVTGWGRTSENGTISKLLNYVKIPVVGFDYCKGIHAKLTDRMMCAGDYSGGIDPCQGDDGGPLMWKDVLFGIFSWNVGCGREQQPGVYTNVNNPSIREFIKDITKL